MKLDAESDINRQISLKEEGMKPDIVWTYEVNMGYQKQFH